MTNPEAIRGGFEQPGNNSNKEQFISTMTEPTATQIDLETEEDVDVGSDVQPYCDEAFTWDIKATALASLNQLSTRKVEDIDLLFKFNNFKPLQTQSWFLLSLDRIVDVFPGSALSLSLSIEKTALANIVGIDSTKYGGLSY
ncbi:hypothetical protein BGZ88_003541 [Linnemannia elongata]|nr:hypothetical protein BGZ88_003541 [Linnemannia elongata]